MKTSTLTVLLQIAGLLHVGLLLAGATMPRAVNLRAHLTLLPSFIRKLFLVYYSFIGLLLIGFGLLTFFFASELATGQPLGRALCILLTSFWTARLVVAGFIFDVRPYLTNWFYRLGYQATNFVFVYFVFIYGATAFNNLVWN